MPTLRRILTAGAPIRPALFRKFEHVLPPETHFHTPYGATEALPVATISSAEVLTDTAKATLCGAGLCVGRAAPFVEIRIIEISDEPISRWEEARELPAGEIGEICVRGPQVTQVYDRKPEHTAKAKIPDARYGADGFWHRMGDVGYLDEKGRLWYCGRKAHRVQTPQSTLFTIPCEAIFNEHPQVFRSALVGYGPPGQQYPAMVIEPRPGVFPKTFEAQSALTEELIQLAAQHELTRVITKFDFMKAFPVDRRHNAKIHREEIALWFARRYKV